VRTYGCGLAPRSPLPMLTISHPPTCTPPMFIAPPLPPLHALPPPLHATTALTTVSGRGTPHRCMATCPLCRHHTDGAPTLSIHPTCHPPAPSPSQAATHLPSLLPSPCRCVPSTWLPLPTLLPCRHPLPSICHPCRPFLYLCPRRLYLPPPPPADDRSHRPPSTAVVAEVPPASTSDATLCHNQHPQGGMADGVRTARGGRGGRGRTYISSSHHAPPPALTYRDPAPAPALPMRNCHCPATTTHHPAWSHHP